MVYIIYFADAIFEVNQILNDLDDRIRIKDALVLRNIHAELTVQNKPAGTFQVITGRVEKEPEK